MDEEFRGITLYFMKLKQYLNKTSPHAYLSVTAKNLRNLE